MLGHILDDLARHEHPESLASDELRELIRQHLPASRVPPQAIELQRGIATIPLKGIDIPFHSTLLRNEIASYRGYLKDKILKKDINPEQLVGKFIPNVIGTPFSIDRSYIEQVAAVTRSEPLMRLCEGLA